MPYTVDPSNPATPLDTDDASLMAAELRGLKALVAALTSAVAIPTEQTPGAAYVWNTPTDPNVTVNTTGTLSMSAPTGLIKGGFYFMEIAFGGAHAITWTAAFKGLIGIMLTATNGAHDVLTFRAVSTTVLELVGYRLNVGV